MAFLISSVATNPRKLELTTALDTKVLALSEHSAVVDAHAILAQACARADEIVAGAQAAFEAERERGYAQGREEALLDQAEKMIETVSRTVDYFSGVEAEMIQLVMAAVRKIVDGFSDTERVLLVVRNALAVVRSQRQMTLRLNADEIEAVRGNINTLLAAYPGVGYLDLVADGRLERGACILESEIGTVEASITSQLKALEAGFERTLGSRG